MTSSGKKLTKKQQQQILKDQFHLNTSTNNINLQSGSNQLDLVDPNLYRKQAGQFEIVPNTLLDLFDMKYSCSFLGIHEQHDLFYSRQKNRSEQNNNLVSCDSDTNSIISVKSKKKKSKRSSASVFKLTSLNVFDENKSGLNVLKRLITKTKINKSKSAQKLKLSQNNMDNGESKLNNVIASNNKSCTSSSSFLYHKWLYEKKEIKSNLELTKSLKHIQPLLEETVQKKYTTSKMWESFQGPLTWQHFCRIAFKVKLYFLHKKNQPLINKTV